MMKCNKCSATLLMEQVPEVHISEAQVPCNQPGCDGMCVYINNKKPLREVVGQNNGVVYTGDGIGLETSVLMEDDPGEHHG